MVDCIQVVKVYDFCFQTETRDMLHFRIPPECGPVPSDATVSATVSSVTCSTVSVTAIGSTGFADVTLLVTVELTITITNSSGVTLCTFLGKFSFFKTIVLCAPSGTTINCESPSSAVSPGLMVNGDVLFMVNICLLIQSVATVNLLVPTFGFCTPAPCVVSPVSPFSCPPSPLFPPQCVFPLPTTTNDPGEAGGPM